MAWQHTIDAARSRDGRQRARDSSICGKRRLISSSPPTTPSSSPPCYHPQRPSPLSSPVLRSSCASSSPTAHRYRRKFHIHGSSPNSLKPLHMETVVSEDSPLAAYLEGKGEAETEPSDASSDSPRQQPPPKLNLAPRGPPSSKHLLRNVARPILHNPAVSRLRKVYAAAVNSTLGSADNERFLEQFRYHIIASQLLNENVGAVPASATFSPHACFSHTVPYPGVNNVSTKGAVVAAFIAFGLVWAIHWARHGSLISNPYWRILLVTILGACIAAGLYGYVTRQWLQSLRRQAIEATTGFVANIQSFEGSSTSVLTLIQEVELVSRGYRLSSPLPPISRLESSGQPRSLLRLRRNLQSCYAEAIPQISQAIKALSSHIDPDEVDRFLDVYDVRLEDVEDASLGYVEETDSDGVSLKSMRVHQARFSTLRRLFLCSLLSLRASGRRDDSGRWRAAVTNMDTIGQTTGTLAEKLIKLLSDEEQVTTPSTPNRRRSLSATHPKHPSHGRVQSQVRRISALSTNIRSLQAKLFLLRDESTRALQSSMSEGDLSELSGSLKDQYDALGADLQALMQAWEAGKQALSSDITKTARRISRASSLTLSEEALRKTTGLGLNSVDENNVDDSPRGKAPLSPPATEDGSEGTADDEIFEALSAPRQRPRSMMTRQERVAKMQEEREQTARRRDKAEANTTMIKELQSVIRLRPPVKVRRGASPHDRTISA